MTQPKLVSSNEIRAILGGISARTLYNWRKLGMPCYRAGSGIGGNRWSPEECLNWLKTRTEEEK